jgi:DNA-binding transcriptional MerR regulator
MRKPVEQKKLLYSISEVSELLGVNQSTLRYWEKEFDSIKPQKSDKGTRYYREKDIEELRHIQSLVKNKGMTIAGAKKKLKENRGNVVKTSEIVTKLNKVKSELLALKAEFENII